MKKMFLCFLCFTFALSLSVGVKANKSTNISASVSDIDYNEKLSVTFDVSDNTGFCAYALQLVYDSENLTLENVSSNLSGALSYSQEFEGVGNLRIVYSQDNNYTDNGTILKLDFTLTGKTQNPLVVAPFGFCDISVADFDGKAVDVEFSGASIDTNAKRLLGFGGDFNNDGFADVTDVTALLRHLAKLDSFDERLLLVADIDKDGEASVSDVTVFLRSLAKLPSQYELMQKVFGNLE